MQAHPMHTRQSAAVHRQHGNFHTRAGGMRTRAAGANPSVVLTREEGKNDKMVLELSQRHMHCIELPLIEHSTGPDRAQVPAALLSGEFDWVTVTSPEAAAVFLEAWHEAGKPQVRVAVVGGGTGEIIEQGGITPAFVSSKAIGKTMGSELPPVPGGKNTVLYPASCKASTDLQDSLAGGGFKVTRLNSYNTAGVTNVSPELLAQAKAADIVTFGSPSAVKAWVALVGLDLAQSKASVCIGSTSARACKAVGLTKVYFPDSPGIPGWVDCVEKAVAELGLVTVQ